jgi:hypothetical protein
LYGTIVEKFDEVQLTVSAAVTADGISLVIERIKLERVAALKFRFLSGLNIDKVACLKCIANG